MAGRVGTGKASCGTVWSGEEWRGMAGMASCGWRVEVRPCMVRPGISKKKRTEVIAWYSNRGDHIHGAMDSGMT